MKSIIPFLTLAGFIALAIASLGDNPVESRAPHNGQSLIEWLYADDGMPVKFPCRHCQ